MAVLLMKLGGVCRLKIELRSRTTKDELDRISLRRVAEQVPTPSVRRLRPPGLFPPPLRPPWQT